jgi:hypothetical protein
MSFTIQLWFCKSWYWISSLWRRSPEPLLDEISRCNLPDIGDDNGSMRLR